MKAEELRARLTTAGFTHSDVAYPAFFTQYKGPTDRTTFAATGQMPQWEALLVPPDMEALLDHALHAALSTIRPGQILDLWALHEMGMRAGREALRAALERKGVEPSEG